MDRFLLLIAVLPVILLTVYIYRQDRFQKEPVNMLIRTFLLGCVSVIPALLLESLLMALYAPLFGSFPSVFESVYDGFVVAGFSEELFKLLLLSLAVWRSSHFDEYFDGIVYATFVSLGFAGVENIMYVFGSESFGDAVATGAVRALLSVPAHFLFGVVMGYYFALAKFQPENRTANFVRALLFPVLLHGTFDALLMVSGAMSEQIPVITLVLFIAFIVFDIIMWRLGIRRLRHLQELSATQAAEDSIEESAIDATTSQEKSPISGFNDKEQ